jgi:tetratricopeptide (TPR) repeat protein
MRCVVLFRALSAFLLLGGCAGIGIVASSDPLTKLEDAEHLFLKQDRPQPAGRLIREAIAIYQERDDPHGLGHGYREYGDFLRSTAVANHESYYRRFGFADKSITFENRLEKASEFYRKALTYYQRAEQQHQDAQKYDRLTNVYYNMAWSHFVLGERGIACDYLDKSLDAHNENVRRNPSAKQDVAEGDASVPDGLAKRKRLIGCS